MELKYVPSGAMVVTKCGGEKTCYARFNVVCPGHIDGACRFGGPFLHRIEEEHILLAGAELSDRTIIITLKRADESVPCPIRDNETEE